MNSDDIKTPDVLVRYFESLHKRDWASFANCIDVDFVYFTDGATMLTRGDFLRFMERNVWMSESYSVEVLRLIEADSGEFQICACRTQFKGQSSSKELSFYALETTVLIKREDGWKLLQSHTSNSSI